MVLSPLALANIDPSELKDTVVTSSVCPVSRLSSLVVCASYNQIPMALATAIIFPSGEYAISGGFRTSLILPLPSRAIVPAGNLHCV